jgi:hypothetical protein
MLSKTRKNVAAMNRIQGRLEAKWRTYIALLLLSLIGFTLLIAPLAPPALAQAVQLPKERPDRPVPARKAPQKAAATKVYQTACPAIMDGALVGKIKRPIMDGDCHVQSPYEIRALNLDGQSIKLSQKITLNCTMATAFLDWAKRLNEQAKAQANSKIKSIQVGTSYMCRRRNNQPTGKISEHGFANGLDVTGFTLQNGKAVKLPLAWQSDGADKHLMRTSHKIACQIFTTVLGPEANALHYDHLHFDMGCHGKSCTYKICE